MYNSCRDSTRSQAELASGARAPREDGLAQDRPGPLNLFGAYQEDCHQGNLARGRTTPTYFKDANGTAYVFFTGSTKPAPCSIVPTTPSVARTKVVTSGPDQHAYLAFDAYESTIVFQNPAIGVISSNGNDFSSAILWLLDSNFLRRSRWWTVGRFCVRWTRAG